MELIGNDIEFQYNIIPNTAISLIDYSNINDNIQYNYIPYSFLTPSEITGMSQKEEKLIRNFLMSFLQEINIILHLPHQSLLTSMNIANHFYWKQPFHKYEPIYILCASIFLAGKIEESIRKPSDILSAALYILSNKSLNQSKDVDYSYLKSFSKMKENIYNAELIILKELGYDLHSLGFHPHCLLLHFIKKINGDAALLQKSWGYLNDMYRTSLVVNYAPNVLACAAIYISGRKGYIALPQKVEWWVIFETRYEEIEEICAEMLRLYEDAKDKFGLNECKRVFRRLEEIKRRDMEKEIEKKENDRKRHKHRHKDRSRSRDRHRHSHHKHRHHSKDRKHSRSKDRKHRHHSHHKKSSRHSSSSESSSFNSRSNS